jgi:catechol 2,3-dioxygenase-like lactoylglutathione lyase family enzyme
MLGRIDHVGYLAHDLERGISVFTETFAMDVVRRFERPQFSLQGAYLGSETGNVEVFTFSDSELLHDRLGERALALDHVAHEVEDIHAVQAALAHAGARFSGPDLRGEVGEPLDLGGVLHLWTVPTTCDGVALQLMQRVET